MINFRYHIVSLMAVFLALAVGIAAGVSLSPSVTGEITTQAEQDRQQVTQLRNELSRRNSLDAYRSTYDQRTGPLVLSGEMPDARVALVVMPDAPGAVVTAIGDTQQMQSALDVDPEVANLRDWSVAVGLGYDVSVLGEQEFPAYSGSIIPEFAEVPES